MINRVREVVQQNLTQEPDKDVRELVRHQAVRRKYLAWNATSAAQAEIIEYLEELIDLAKLLVGANEFQSGLLMRSTYHDYARGLQSVESRSSESEKAIVDESEARDEIVLTSIQSPSTARRRRVTSIQSLGSGGDRVPASLQRIQSRKMEAGIKRQATNEGWGK